MKAGSGTYWHGVALACSTALLWGLSAPMTKLISKDGLSMMSVSVLRCIVITLLLGALRLRRGAPLLPAGGRSFSFYLLLGFATTVCMSAGYMISCVYLSVPQAVMLHYTFPLLTIFGDALICRERPNVLQILSAFGILIGVYIGFDVGGSGGGTVSIIGLIWGIVSVAGFAAQGLLVRCASRGGSGDPFEQIYFTHLLGGVMMIAGKSLLQGWGDLAHITPYTLLLAQYPVLISGFVALVCLFASLRYISATTMSLICSLEIVFTLLATPFLLGGGYTPQELIGCSVVLFSVVGSTLARPSPAKPAEELSDSPAA